MKGTDLSDISSIMDGESDNSMNVSSSMPMNTDKFSTISLTVELLDQRARG